MGRAQNKKKKAVKKAAKRGYFGAIANAVATEYLRKGKAPKAKTGKRFFDGNSISFFGSAAGDAAGNAGSQSLGYNPKSTRSLGVRGVGVANTPAFKATPGMRFRPVKHMGVDAVRVDGCDLLTTLQGVDATAGQPLFTSQISPSSLSALRLAQFTNLYERWSVNNLTFEYSTASPTTTPGQLLMYVDYDALAADIGADFIPVQQAAGHQTQCNFAAYENAEMCFDPKMCAQELYTLNDGTEERLSSAGQFTIIAATNTDFSAASTSLGLVYIHYDVIFYKPQASANVATVNGVYSTANLAVSDVTSGSLSTAAQAINSGTSTTPPLDSIGLVVSSFANSSLTFTPSMTKSFSQNQTFELSITVVTTSTVTSTPVVSSGGSFVWINSGSSGYPPTLRQANFNNSVGTAYLITGTFIVQGTPTDSDFATITWNPAATTASAIALVLGCGPPLFYPLYTPLLLSQRLDSARNRRIDRIKSIHKVDGVDKFLPATPCPRPSEDCEEFNLISEAIGEVLEGRSIAEQTTILTKQGNIMAKLKEMNITPDEFAVVNHLSSRSLDPVKVIESRRLRPASAQ